MILDWHKINFEFSDEEMKAHTYELGRAIFAFSTLEIQVAHALSAALGTGHLPHGEALVATIDAVNKQKFLDGFASVFTNPSAAGEDVKPDLMLANRFKKLARLFQGLLKQRNVLAHGTFAKYGDRALIGSMQLSARLRANGGSDNWVWFDELPDYHARCSEALERANALRTDFLRAHLTIAERPAN